MATSSYLLVQKQFRDQEKFLRMIESTRAICPFMASSMEAFICGIIIRRMLWWGCKLLPLMLGCNAMQCRDANAQGDGKPEKCLWVPRTLRIDDPDEAAKSSIWATLGIKNDQSEPITKGEIFKAFQPKVEGKPHSLEATQVLHANPTALS